MTAEEPKPTRPARDAQLPRQADASARERTGQPTADRIGEPTDPPETALRLLLDRTTGDAETLREAARTLSHELRTPLTTIYSGSKLLARHGSRLSESTVREVSAAMEADAERLLRVVEDLVVAAGLPGEPAIRGEPVLLQRLLPAVARTARHRWPHATVVVLLADQLPAASADELYVEQILRNLIDNAAQYGPDRGRIVVRADIAGDRLEIHVLDEGPGIDADQADEVFRMFAGPGTRARQGGLGLGLFVARRLTERMGGRMWLATRHGRGADFAFDLPAYPADER
jgi:signal transduction histidine kinase